MTDWTHKINLGRAFDPVDGNFSEHRDRCWIEVALW